MNSTRTGVCGKGVAGGQQRHAIRITKSSAQHSPVPAVANPLQAANSLPGAKTSPCRTSYSSLEAYGSRLKASTHPPRAETSLRTAQAPPSQSALEASRLCAAASGSSQPSTAGRTPPHVTRRAWLPRVEALPRSFGPPPPRLSTEAGTPLAFPRRALLLSAASMMAALSAPWPPSAHAAAQKLRSERWDTPTILTVLNDCGVPIKAYWVNYDGVPELCNVLAPGTSWTVETYETHPWRFVNSATGNLVQECVAAGGHQVVHVSDTTAAASPASQTSRRSISTPAKSEEVTVLGSERAEAAELAEAEFDGFDGIGNGREHYVAAKVLHVSMGPIGGVVSLGVEGDMHAGVISLNPLDIYVGLPEAAAMFLALGVELRRPQTSLTWSNTLKAVGARVDRVLITRVVGETFYARIVLTLPGGSQRSVDSRPSDSLALALQNAAPVYLAKEVAELLLSGTLERGHFPGVEKPTPDKEAQSESPSPPHPSVPGGPRDPYLWMKDAKNA